MKTGLAYELWLNKKINKYIKLDLSSDWVHSTKLHNAYSTVSQTDIVTQDPYIRKVPTLTDPLQNQCQSLSHAVKMQT